MAYPRAAPLPRCEAGPAVFGEALALDAGALTALDQGDRRVVALLVRAHETAARITIPATALAQAMRRPSRQARLARLIRRPTTDLVALDGPDATTVGILLAATKTDDIVDAHVVVCARRTGQAVVTSDPADLRRLDPSSAWSWSEARCRAHGAGPPGAQAPPTQ